jgi:extracellular factor (EF) 3-hydroxypalmitic acid methyl ester biosynthesis protein
MNTQEILDPILKKFEAGQVTIAMEELCLATRLERDFLPEAEWKSFAEEGCPTHPIRNWVHQDPFTYRSYSKPRGYSGDAELLDYIYAPDEYVRTLEGIPAAIFNYTTDSPACRSVRERARIIARTIDAMASQKPIQVLSVACGHLREAKLAASLRSGNILKYWALDQDVDSLDEVRRAAYADCVVPVEGSVRSLLTKKHQFENIDFVYAAGLYDYLNDAVASRLTEVLFGFLTNGGKLLIPNFTPDLFDIGYMETFMGWKLIYRKEEDMLKLIAGLPHGSYQARQYRDIHRNIVYLELTKLQEPTSQD